MKINNIMKVLEIGAGHRRDSIFFASKGVEIEALNCSGIAVKLLDKITKEKRLSLRIQFFDVKHNSKI